MDMMEKDQKVLVQLVGDQDHVVKETIIPEGLSGVAGEVGFDGFVHSDGLVIFLKTKETHLILKSVG